MALPASDEGPLLPVGNGLKLAIEELTKRIWPVPEEIGRLITAVNQITAVLEDAENKQINSRAVRLWLRDAKEVALDAEDLFDELATDAALQSRGAPLAELGHRTCNIPPMTPDMKDQIRDLQARADDLALQVGIRPTRGVSTSGTALLAAMAVMMMLPTSLAEKLGNKKPGSCIVLSIIFLVALATVVVGLILSFTV